VRRILALARQTIDDTSIKQKMVRTMAYVLLVDDEQSFRSVIAASLRHAGYEIGEAENGKQCEAAVNERRPDLVILDVLMPEQDGVETLRALRRRYPDLKILAISGGAFDRGLDWLDIAKQFGADAVLAKPFSNRALVAEVKRLLTT